MADLLAITRSVNAAFGVILLSGATALLSARSTPDLAPGKAASSVARAVPDRPERAKPDAARTDGPDQATVSIAQPIGKVTIGPEFVSGETRYAHRSTVREGMTVVELSAIDDMSGTAGSQITDASGRLAYAPNTQPDTW